MEKKVEVAVDGGKDGAAATSKQVEKTVSTLKHNHGDCTTKMTFANDKMAFEGKGKLVDDDGWKVDITGAGETKQAKKEWKLTGNLDVKSPDMGGAKGALNVSFCLSQNENDNVPVLLTNFYFFDLRPKLSTTRRVKSPSSLL